MMLIENNKRGKNNSITLIYSENDEKFYIPENLYIIGTINTSDDTLEEIGYPLRRRFVFIDIEPVFENEDLRNYFGDYIGVEMAEKVICKMSHLNKIIEKDSQLGKKYKIGQSYFMCEEKIEEYLVDNWYRHIIKRDIEPLLKEMMVHKKDSEVNDIIQSLIVD